MADILIRGMEMPKYTTKAEFGIDADGNPLCMVYHEDGTEPDIYDVVSLPEGHGRLIDADALLNNNGVGTQIAGWGKMFHETAIAYAPTIVPAEGETDNGF